MSIFKISLSVFLACVCLRWWFDSATLVNIVRASAGIAAVALIFDK